MPHHQPTATPAEVLEVLREHIGEVMSFTEEPEAEEYQVSIGKWDASFRPLDARVPPFATLLPIAHPFAAWTFTALARRPRDHS